VKVLFNTILNLGVINGGNEGVVGDCLKFGKWVESLDIEKIFIDSVIGMFLLE
jgi:hypothetical protein